MLTEPMIKGGGDLIKALDNQGASPTAALWLYLSDRQTWKLLLAENELQTAGPKQLYKKIQDLLSDREKGIEGISLDDIALTRPETPILNLLKQAIPTGPEIKKIRFTNNVINGTLIEDALIYRLN